MAKPAKSVRWELHPGPCPYEGPAQLAKLRTDMVDAEGIEPTTCCL